MTVQPIDLPALVKANVWPSIAIVALVVFRRPAGDLVVVLGQRIPKFSIGGVSLD